MNPKNKPVIINNNNKLDNKLKKNKRYNPYGDKKDFIGGYNKQGEAILKQAGSVDNPIVLVDGNSDHITAEQLAGEFVDFTGEGTKATPIEIVEKTDAKIKKKRRTTASKRKVRENKEAAEIAGLIIDLRDYESKKQKLGVHVEQLYTSGILEVPRPGSKLSSDWQRSWRERNTTSPGGRHIQKNVFADWREEGGCSCSLGSSASCRLCELLYEGQRLPDNRQSTAKGKKERPTSSDGMLTATWDEEVKDGVSNRVYKVSRGFGEASGPPSTPKGD